MIGRGMAAGLFVFVCLAGAVLVFPHSAQAIPICVSCTAEGNWHTILQSMIKKEHRNSRKFMSRQFDDSWDDDDDDVWDEIKLNTWDGDDDDVNSPDDCGNDPCHDHEGGDSDTEAKSYVFLTCAGDGTDDCDNVEDYAFDYNDECRNDVNNGGQAGICWNTRAHGRDENDNECQTRDPLDPDPPDTTVVYTTPSTPAPSVPVPTQTCREVRCTSVPDPRGTRGPVTPDTCTSTACPAGYRVGQTTHTLDGRCPRIRGSCPATTIQTCQEYRCQAAPGSCSHNNTRGQMNNVCTSQCDNNVCPSGWANGTLYNRINNGCGKNRGACPPPAPPPTGTPGSTTTGTRGACLYVPNDPKDLLLNVIWPKIPPYLVRIAREMTLAAMNQAAQIGALLDGKQSMEVQRELRSMMADAEKTYRPSAGVCALGTAARGLHTGGMKADAGLAVMAEATLDRQAGNSSTAAAGGDAADKVARLAQFRQFYCDPNNNGGGLSDFCGAGGYNFMRDKDADYGRTIDDPQTLDINFSTGAATLDSINVMTLSQNLYGNKVPRRIDHTAFDNPAARDALMDVRSLIAKRNVAAASYNAIVGMKAAGNSLPVTDASYANTGLVLRRILERLGTTPDEALAELGGAPSYYAQMGVLAKKIYQDPRFYQELYDSPANVGRKKVVLQAIGLMQDYDTLQSYLRTEMMLSVMLELEVVKLQERAESARALMKVR